MNNYLATILRLLCTHKTLECKGIGCEQLENTTPIMTTKIEIADSNMKSRFSCEVKNSLIFHRTEIVVVFIDIRKMRSIL